MTAPSVTLKDIVAQIETSGTSKGVWAPKLRRELKNEGYLILKGVNGEYTAHKEHPCFVGGATRVRLSKKLPKSVKTFYYDRGFDLMQMTLTREGCGYPSDSWDICECQSCRNGEVTKIGYDVRLVPFKKVE